jgi:hypothetical protein
VVASSHRTALLMQRIPAAWSCRLRDCQCVRLTRRDRALRWAAVLAVVLAMVMASAGSAADILNAVAALLWVLLAAAVLLLLAGLIRRSGALKKLSIGPSGVSMDFADQKLQEAIQGADPETRAVVGQAARRTIIDRLQMHADRLRSARILWVDDHPENNTPIIVLLREYGAVVDTPRTNDHALGLMSAAKYDVVISDVGRDNEGSNSALKAVELARLISRGSTSERCYSLLGLIPPRSPISQMRTAFG